MGLRIPIVRWISSAAEFDYTMVGMKLRDERLAGAGRFSGWTLGSVVAGSLAFTIHI